MRKKLPNINTRHLRPGDRFRLLLNSTPEEVWFICLGTDEDGWLYVEDRLGEIVSRHAPRRMDHRIIAAVELDHLSIEEMLTHYDDEVQELGQALNRKQEDIALLEGGF